MTSMRPFWLVSLFVATSVYGQATQDVAWGPAVDGLRIGLSARSVPSGAVPVLEVWFENAGEQDFLLNLGVMLANGKRMEPSALTLGVSAPAGGSASHSWFDPTHVGGRVDDMLVSVRAGGRYMLVAEIDRFRDASEYQRLRLGPGRHTLRIRFTGGPAQHLNLDTPGVGTFNFWQGSVESAAITLVAPR
jgi:hypothetical protein